MTMKEYAEQYCVERGMFPSQAKAVIELVMANKANEAMVGRWSDQTSDYPPVMLRVMPISINPSARQWIQDNAPQAWFAPMFADEISEPESGTRTPSVSQPPPWGY